MTAHGWTAEKAEALKRLCDWEWTPHREVIADALAEIDRLTAQVREAETQWEALKDGADEIHAHWSSFHSVAPSAVASVQALIVRLEGKRP